MAAGGGSLRDDETSMATRAAWLHYAGGLTQADIERMVREAEQNAAEDRRRRELVELRNQADAAIYEKEQQAAASPQPDAAGGAGGEAGDEEVVDAEFSEVDENNKG